MCCLQDTYRQAAIDIVIGAGISEEVLDQVHAIKLGLDRMTGNSSLKEFILEIQKPKTLNYLYIYIYFYSVGFYNLFYKKKHTTLMSLRKYLHN